ncbi:MobA/MobL family protein [Moraxella ovis]|uniref:MobA/MobL family protein n=2 Tax=Moraxella ovis TaxID=29433 RepID=UPI0011BE0C71|nr:MobA/MobL family protein [Moraxella ovis]
MDFSDRVDMALGRISVKIGKIGKGGPHAKYILAAEKYCQKQKEIKFTSYGNLPSWAKDDPIKFFETADSKERKNGQAYREHILSLPRELNLDQQKELLADWIEKRIGDKHAYLLAIHIPTASDGKDQPHAHLMYNQRINDGIERTQEHYFKRYNAKNPNKGGCQKADTGLAPAQLKANLLDERQAWELTVNKHLEMNGFDVKVDLRNYQERGAEPPNNIDIWDYKELQRLNKNLEDKKPDPEPAPAPTRSYGMGM